jgi:hypothetical protein
MFGTHFYHQKVRKCVAMFGTLFNNIYVIRKNTAGAAISQVKTPLSYAPKEKYLERIRENPDLSANSQVALKLPRMSFEITSFAYDPTRQLTKVSNFNTIGTANTNRQKFFSPVPYNINFQLNIYAKTQDDALQMVEQIIPTFNPQYTLTIKPFSSEYPDFKEDIPIVIQSLSFADDFEGAVEQRRTIIYTLDFEMKVQFYGAIANSEIIRTANTDLYTMYNNPIGARLDYRGLADSDSLVERITTTPDPTNAIGLADSDFGFSTDINIFNEPPIDTEPYFVDAADPYVTSGYVETSR